MHIRLLYIVFSGTFNVNVVAGLASSCLSGTAFNTREELGTGRVPRQLGEYKHTAKHTHILYGALYFISSQC